jgi:hypothetical protein
VNEEQKYNKLQKQNTYEIYDTQSNKWESKVQLEQIKERYPPGTLYSYYNIKTDITY